MNADVQTDLSPRELVARLHAQLEEQQRLCAALTAANDSLRLSLAKLVVAQATANTEEAQKPFLRYTGKNTVPYVWKGENKEDNSEAIMAELHTVLEGRTCNAEDLNQFFIDCRNNQEQAMIQNKTPPSLGHLFYTKILVGLNNKRVEQLLTALTDDQAEALIRSTIIPVTWTSMQAG